MTRTILAVAAVLAMACGGGDDGTAPEWRFADPLPDEAVLDMSCSTPAAITRGTMSTERGGTAATCPPDAMSWWTYGDAPVFHCEWRCVSYACEAGQDVRIDYGNDGHILAVVSGPSAYCN